MVVWFKQDLAQPKQDIIPCKTSELGQIVKPCDSDSDYCCVAEPADEAVDFVEIVGRIPYLELGLQRVR